MGRLWLGLMSGAGALAVTTAMVPLALGQLHASWPARGSSQGSAVVGTFPTPAPCTGPEWSGATVHTLVPGQGPFFAGNGKNIVNGSTGPDLVGGGNGMDCLLGAAGDDVLSGGRGNDYIDGGPGFDICFAILGDDTVVNCEVVIPVHDGFQHTPMPASADSADGATAPVEGETEDQPGGDDAGSTAPSGEGAVTPGDDAAREAPGAEETPDPGVAPDDEGTDDPAATATADDEPPAGAPPPADDSEPPGTGLPSTGDVAVFIDSPPPAPPAIAGPPEDASPGPGVVVSGGGAPAP